MDRKAFYASLRRRTSGVFGTLLSQTPALLETNIPAGCFLFLGAWEAQPAGEPPVSEAHNRYSSGRQNEKLPEIELASGGEAHGLCTAHL